MALERREGERGGDQEANRAQGWKYDLILWDWREGWQPCCLLGVIWLGDGHGDSEPSPGGCCAHGGGFVGEHRGLTASGEPFRQGPRAASASPAASRP